jgi:hypothetical protein
LEVCHWVRGVDRAPLIPTFSPREKGQEVAPQREYNLDSSPLSPRERVGVRGVDPTNGIMTAFIEYHADCER